LGLAHRAETDELATTEPGVHGGACSVRPDQTQGGAEHGNKQGDKVQGHTVSPGNTSDGPEDDGGRRNCGRRAAAGEGNGDEGEAMGASRSDCVHQEKEGRVAVLGVALARL
jgi:hypothetical protein